MTTWVLKKEDFDAHDALWCRGLDVEYSAEPLNKDVYLSGRINHSIRIGWKIRLYTTTPKQENMLKLKYGSALVEIECQD